MDKNQYEERVFWLGKFQARQEACCWFRDFEGQVIIWQIDDDDERTYKTPKS